MGQFLSQRANQQTGTPFRATDVPVAEALTLFREPPALNETLRDQVLPVTCTSFSWNLYNQWNNI